MESLLWKTTSLNPSINKVEKVNTNQGSKVRTLRKVRGILAMNKLALTFYFSLCLPQSA